MLVNPELGGVTLGWNLTHTAQDELFAAIEGTAFHTRIILERMAEHGVPIRRVINGGGIPQKNETLNRVYANVLDKPVLVPEDEVTSLGSAIFAFLAAGTFQTIEEAQQALCPSYRTVEPDPPRDRRLREALPALPQALLQPRQPILGRRVNRRRAPHAAPGRSRCAGVNRNRGARTRARRVATHGDARKPTCFCP